jgi:hypothetical protein
MLPFVSIERVKCGATGAAYKMLPIARAASK